MKQTKNLVTSGMCVALAIVLPIAFHMIPDAGKVFLPMHIPVLLCGLLCGPVYGLGCGISVSYTHLTLPTNSRV